jgi:hypothetical protein
MVAPNLTTHQKDTRGHQHVDQRPRR